MNLPSLSLLIPIYNEITLIQKVLDSIFYYLKDLEFQVIIVDDCSDDGSYDLLVNLQKKYPFTLLKHRENHGKGAAIMTALPYLTKQYTIIQDADLEYSPQEILKLLHSVAVGKADVVYGVRIWKNPWALNYWANIVITFLHRLFSSFNIKDVETCYKLFPTDWIKGIPLSSKRFGFEIEVTSYLSKSSLRLDQVSIDYNPRGYLEGKKIGWKDGIAAFWHILYFYWFKKM